VGSTIEPARDAWRRIIEIDCNFFRGPFQRVEMGDVVFTPRTRSTVCVLDRFDSVTSVVAGATNFFNFHVKLGCWAVIDHNEIVSQDYLNLFLIFEDYSHVA
jgi:hypothetical protein